MSKSNDIEVVKEMGLKHIYLNTISHDFLDDFHLKTGMKASIKGTTVRTRFRNALNECALAGIAEKEYHGGSYFQTASTLGGKSYISYSFLKYFYQLTEKQHEKID